MRKVRIYLGIVITFIFLLISFSPQAITLLSLPDNQKIVVGQSEKININLPPQLENKIEMSVMGPSKSVFALPQDPPVTVVKNAEGYEITALKPGKVDVKLKLLGYIPIRSMEVVAVPTKRVVVGGHSIGVVMQSRGIMVVGFAPIVGNDGEKLYPAKESGVEIGDLILSVDNQEVKTENELANIVDNKKGRELTLHIKRGSKILTIPIRACFCPETGRYRVGLYVRDGIVGVGTLTFFDPETKQYAALGHIIMDSDTKQSIEVLDGKIVSASIQGIKAAKPGKPGEKIGIFDSQGIIKGNISKNSFFGIYGKIENGLTAKETEHTMEIGYAHEVKTGKAKILTVINGEDVESFDIIIEKVYPHRDNGKGMVIRVVDQRLLNITGGIVQGMSGSPIIQNSKLVGAVTHVFLNDPERGYGIFMDNMLSELAEEE
ncbi:MAG: SpoIVB peptidase [Syntrophomonadaceae bacterium]